MVLEIRLSNFFSIKDEVVLDMQAASIQTKKAKEVEDCLRVVIPCTITGSGKLLWAILTRFCTMTVAMSISVPTAKVIVRE